MNYFKIFYYDHSVYDGTAFDAPGLGVICILEEGRIIEKYDFYVWKFMEKGWTGVDWFGLMDYLIQPGMKKVLFGRTVENQLFETIHLQAYQELKK